MMILSCNNISKAFLEKVVLSEVSFHINEKDKTAIIGNNGAGKSTLVKIILGEIKADSGEVIISKNTSVGYLAQHQSVDSEKTIYDELLNIKKNLLDIENNIRQIEKDMKSATEEELELMLKKYSNLTHEFEINNGYSYKSEIIGVLKGLGFEEVDFDRKINTLSGGQKTRVALGRLLLSNPDLIILDEPTNHLDINSISWLENYLANYKGAVIIVAHDRFFLDKVVNKVIGIDNTKASMYEGNYTEYAKKAALIREAQIKQYLNQQKEIKRQEEIIEKLKSFNREKSIKRAESREKMLNKIDVLQKPVELDDKMRIKFEPRIVSGNDVLNVEGLTKSFGDNLLFEDISFEVKKGEKVALIGDNGTGKTTILKIINNIISANEGTIKLGSKVKIGYYDQEQQLLNYDNNLFEEISDEYPHLSNTEIRNILAAFLFTNDDVFKKISDLSGGEKGRISLAKLMLSEANFLILDEPTNHLDIVSKELLEDALLQYTGTVLYVSHDRYFINRTATRVLDLKKQNLLNYAGNYEYYLEKRDIVEATNIEKDINKQNINSLNDTESKKNWKNMKEQQAAIRKKANDLKKIEEEISSVEQRINEIDGQLGEESIFSNPAKLLPLNNERNLLEEKLEKLMEEWEILVV